VMKDYSKKVQLIGNWKKVFINLKMEVLAKYICRVALLMWRIPVVNVIARDELQTFLEKKRVIFPVMVNYFQTKTNESV